MPSSSMQIMGGDLGFGRGQPVQRALGVGHAGVVKHDHRHRQRALVEIRRRPFDHVQIHARMAHQLARSVKPSARCAGRSLSASAIRLVVAGRADKGRAPCCRRPACSVWPITVSPAPSISQPSVGHRRRQPVERQRFLLGAEIEQDVAAQHDVEAGRMRRRLEQIVDLEADRACAAPRPPPAVAAFLEPADHLGDAEPALDLELGVVAAPGAVDHRARDVGAEDVDRPAAPFSGSSANSIASE